MSSEDQKAEYVSRAKLSEQAERYDDMAEFMRLVTESGIGKWIHREKMDFWKTFSVDGTVMLFFAFPRMCSNLLKLKNGVRNLK